MLFAKLVEQKFVVEGIHCNKCKANVEKTLLAIDGVKKVNVNLDGNVTIKSKKEIDLEVIKSSIEEAGFNVKF